MGTSASRRYCGLCHARLASDNRGQFCSPCQRAESSPPEVPPEFWLNEELRHALVRERHIGHAIRAIRNHPYHGYRGIPQEKAAKWLSISQSQLARIENGRPVTDLDRLANWARTLRLPQELLWFSLPEETKADNEAAGPESISPLFPASSPLPLAAPEPALPTIARQPTLLRTLITERHWQRFETFEIQFSRAAKELAEREGEPCLARVRVSARQYERWYSGKVKTTPHPNACRILEHMFGLPVKQLLGPANAESREALERALRGGEATRNVVPTDVYSSSGDDLPNADSQVGGDVERRAILSGIAALSLPPLSRSFMNYTYSRESHARSLPTSVPPEIVGYFRSQIEGHYVADLLLGPRQLVTMVTSQYEILSNLADTAREDKTRFELLRIGAAYAGFITWLYQDSGNYLNATMWANETLEIAHRIQDIQLISHALVNKAMLYADLGNGKATVELSEAALNPGGALCAKVRIQAMQQAAHGYSMVDDRSRVDELLDGASELIAFIDDDFPWGDASRRSAFYIEAQRATCYGRMRLAGEACSLWQEVVGGLPSEFQRDKGVYLARHASVAVMYGQPEKASALIGEAVPIASHTGSARITQELRKAWRQFKPWHDTATGREISGMLADVGIE
jgi:transcriptional regulator with XRE-family HTH domain